MTPPKQLNPILISRLEDGLNYYKNGDLTLKETIDGFTKLILEYTDNALPTKLTDRLIRLSHLKRILTELDRWDKQIDDRLEEFKETGL